MKRSGFKLKTYTQAQEAREKSQARQRARLAEKTSPTLVLAQKTSLRNSPETAGLRGWKKAVRERDDCKCQFPGCTIKDPHIDCHHLNPRSQRKDLIYVVSNGACLCRAHHKWVGNNPTKAVGMKLLSTRSRELAMKEGTIGIY